MKFAVYQFASTSSIDNNLKIIKKAICQAANQQARLVVFHECALCGYPPIESNIDEIKETDIAEALEEISRTAAKEHIFVAIGTVRFDDSQRYNSVMLFDDNGIYKGSYDKMALWGWDSDNFQKHHNSGIFEIDGIRVGFRICFDVRFPEIFRELYLNQVNLCFVSFSDTADRDNQVRYDLIKAYLMTRAAENVMTVASVNSISRYQTAPTAVFDYDGEVNIEAQKNQEEMLIYDYEIPEETFGMKGRTVNNDYFIEMAKQGFTE